MSANYEEAQGAQTRADVVAKRSIVFKESRETRYWLCPLSRARIVAHRLQRDLIDEADQLTRIMRSLVKNSRTNLPHPHPPDATSQTPEPLSESPAPNQQDDKS